MFDRFTDRARESMGFARNAAQQWNHDYIGTEHILLGLLEVQGVARDVFGLVDLDESVVRASVSKRMTRGECEVTVSQLPFTPPAKHVLEQALEEASKLGHNYIGTEHLFLGLIRGKGGIAAEVLADLDVQVDDVREEILEILGSGPGPETHASEIESLAEEVRLLTARLEDFERLVKSRFEDIERRLDEK